MVKIDIMWRIIEVRALLLIVEGHPGPYMPIPYIRSIMGTIIMILVLIILYIGWGFWISCTRLGSLAGRASALRFCRSLALSRSFAVRRPADPADPPDPADAAAFTLIFKRWCEKSQKSV